MLDGTGKIVGRAVDTAGVGIDGAGLITFRTKLIFLIIAPRPLLTPPYEQNLRLAVDGFITSILIISLLT